MKKKPTLRQLAKELEIAPSTVLRALSGQPNVSPELRNRVIEKAASKKYTLPNHRTNNVAVFMQGMGFGSYDSLLAGCLRIELHQQGFRSYILSEMDADGLNDYMFDGVISTTWFSGIEKKFPKNHMLPLISLNTMDNHMEGVYTVASDNFNGMLTGLTYLQEHGCRKIMFVVSQPKGNLSSSDRVAAFQHFCKARKSYGKEDFLLYSNNHPMEYVVQTALKQKADAIFYATEGIGPELYYELHRHGIKIPDDISVVGLEAAPLNQFLEPPMTSLRQDFEGLAKESVNMLKKLISGEPVHANILLPYLLIERDSVKKTTRKKSKK